MTGLFSSSRFEQHPPGNPPRIFRSQSTVSCVEKFSGDGWKMVITKTPPVAGINATSPRPVWNVESSSWANYYIIDVEIGRMLVNVSVIYPEAPNSASPY